MTPNLAVKYMIETGLTQQEIADKCGVSQATISLIYNDKGHEPSRRLWNELVRLGNLAKRRLGK